VASALPARSTLVSFVRFERCDSPAGSAVDRRQTTPWYAALVMSAGAPGVRAVDLGPASGVDGLVDRWRALMLKSGTGSGTAAVVVALGDSLRRRLWDGLVEGANESTRVFVVPDGRLSLLPFAALPGSDGSFVLEHCGPIAYLSAERDLASVLPRADDQGWFVLGDPDFSRAVMATSEAVGELRATQGEAAEPPASYASVYRGRTSQCEDFRALAFSRLLQSGAEARDIAELSRRGAVPVAMLTGAEASEQSFKRYAPGRSLIHVASHGFFFSSRCSREPSDEESPLIRSGIALAGANERAQIDHRADEDGILTAEEVATLNLTAARCVFLSACESGVGDASTGEGVIGLRRAFHEAGAGALVSTLWEVEDSATRLWVREFYRAYLDSGSDPALAARQASLTIVHRQRPTSRQPGPATWGAFLVSGIGTPIPKR
jgi:CHAT domain-containing protein